MNKSGEVMIVLIVFTAIVAAVFISEKIDSKKDIYQNGQYAEGQLKVERGINRDYERSPDSACQSPAREGEVSSQGSSC